MEQLSKDDYFSSPDFTEMWIFVAFLAHHFHGHFSLLALPISHIWVLSFDINSNLLPEFSFHTPYLFWTAIYLSNNICMNNVEHVQIAKMTGLSIVLVQPQMCETW